METVSRGEMVEKELDSLIRRRDTLRRQTEGERLEEELYEPSVSARRQRSEPPALSTTEAKPTD